MFVMSKVFMQRIERAVAVLRAVEDAITVLLVVVMVLLAASQILLRNVWDVGLVWADPLLRVMVLWVGLLGAMVATRTNNHITIDVLSRFLPPLLKRIARWVTGLFASAVCALIAYEGVRFVAMEYEAGTQVFSSVPSWCCELIIPLAFAVMALRFLFVTIHPVPEPS